MMSSDSPIFVAGLERSGTSLAYALLASHPNIAMSRRTNLWTHFYGQYGELSDAQNLDRCLAMMSRYKRLAKLNPDWNRLRSDFETGEKTYGRLFALLEEQHARSLGKPRWGDKSLNTERYTEQILEAYGRAKILHMIRDPRDRYASSLARWKVRRGGVGAGTAEWLWSADLAVENARRYPDHCMTVRYESLASSPIETLRAICDFIGESFVPEMLSMEGSGLFRDEGGNSSYGSRRPGEISNRSIGKYQTVLSPQQIYYMQLVAGNVMSEFEYERVRISLSSVQLAAFFSLRFPFETLRRAAWHARESYRDQIGRAVPSYRLVNPSEGSRWVRPRLPGS